jgi:hypothetical protein
LLGYGSLGLVLIVAKIIRRRIKILIWFWNPWTRFWIWDRFILLKYTIRKIENRKYKIQRIEGVSASIVVANDRFKRGS